MADDNAHLDDHGQSVAGWTGAILIIAGAALIGLGIGLSHEWLWWIGAGVVAVGAIAGFALSRSGFGHQRLEKPMDHDEWVSAQSAASARSAHDAR